MKAGLLVLLVAFCCGLQACKPSTYLRTDDGQAEDPRPSKSSPPSTPAQPEQDVRAAEPLAFPSGWWHRSSCEVFDMKVAGDTVLGIVVSGPYEGFILKGLMEEDTLALSVGLTDAPAMGLGTVRLVDAEHAYYQFQGVISGHGLFHFGHVAPEDACDGPPRAKPSGPPLDLRPVDPAANE